MWRTCKTDNFKTRHIYRRGPMFHSLWTNRLLLSLLGLWSQATFLLECSAADLYRDGWLQACWVVTPQGRPTQSLWKLTYSQEFQRCFLLAEHLHLSRCLQRERGQEGTCQQCITLQCKILVKVFRKRTCWARTSSKETKSKVISDLAAWSETCPHFEVNSHVSNSGFEMITPIHVSEGKHHLSGKVEIGLGLCKLVFEERSLCMFPQIYASQSVECFWHTKSKIAGGVTRFTPTSIGHRKHTPWSGGHLLLLSCCFCCEQFYWSL